MPNRWTFSIKPIKILIDRYVLDDNWIDPFSGKLSPAKITNDLNPQMPALYHFDALSFLKRGPTSCFSGCLYDPPHSITQAAKCYKSFGKAEFNIPVSRMDYWSKCKDEIARVIKPKGIAICCGWCSNGIGKNRGFEMLEILLVAHGGNKNDTIVTVERKL